MKAEIYSHEQGCWLTNNVILSITENSEEQSSISGFQDATLGVTMTKERTLSKYSTMGMGTGLLSAP